MSILAAIIDWNRTPEVGRAGAVLSGFPARRPDGCFYVEAPQAILACGLRVTQEEQRTQLRPLKDSRARICAVGDLRLDNRDELRAALGSEGVTHLAPGDLRLLVAGYRRWGTELARRLVGDFAFVIWDWDQRRVYAARDSFGVRSLVYRSSAAEMIFATDAAQLLALADTDRTPDEQTVVDALSWSYGSYGPTYFQAIRSVQPGYYLEAREGMLREVEYFEPPSQPILLRSAGDYQEQFREIFERAVRDRLSSDGPILAHLSGGLDSSSIACMADRVYSDDPGQRPPLFLASALHPGQPHDEKLFIDAVAGSMRFPARSWDGNVPSHREFSAPSLSFPGGSVFFGGGSTGDLEIAKQQGCRVLLSGEGGDQVTSENGLFHDLIARGRWLTLIRQITGSASAHDRSVRIRMARRAATDELPAPLVALWRLRHRRRPPLPAPSWLQRNQYPRWTDWRSWRPRRAGCWLSRMQAEAWGFLRWSRLSWVVDILGAYCADSGIEVRYPFLDIRLVRFMLAIPVEQRLLGPKLRWLHRQSMRPLLPPKVVERDFKANFSSAVVNWGRRSVQRMREILDDSDDAWLSRRFTDRRESLALLDQCSSASVDRPEHWENWRSLRSIINLELWHRAVLRYPLSQERMPMSKVSEVAEGKESTEPERLPRAAYVPPVLTGIGNVRELLAGSNLSGTDSGQPQTMN
jgi:asparagine synthase (glutamine-hydrolysing)